MLPMEVRQLVTGSSVIHECALLHFVSEFIDYVALVGKHRSDVIFFFLSTDEENLVLALDRSEFLGQNIGVSDRNFNSGLGVQLVDEQTFMFLVVVVQPWLDTRQNVVRLERDYVVEETSELVNLRFHLDLWSGIDLHGVDMRVDHILELVVPLLKVVDKMLLLENLKVALGGIEDLQFFDIRLNFLLELRKFVQSLVGKVLRRRLIVLDTL